MRLILDNVFDKLQPDKEIYEEHTGRYIVQFKAEIGKPIKFLFWDGYVLTSEIVIDIEENGYGFWIETTNRLWKLDKK